MAVASAPDAFRDALDAYEKHRDQATQRQRYRITATGREVTCRSGCSNCCAQMVAITLADAFLIARWLIRSRPVHELRHLVFRLRADGEAQARAGDPVSWLSSSDLRPCTFLGADGTCGVYPVRPVNCRRMYVTTPAAWCSPANLLRVVREESYNAPVMEPWPELDPVSAEAQEVVRPLLRAAGIQDDLPPAPLPLAVAAALHMLLTGDDVGLRTWRP